MAKSLVSWGEAVRLGPVPDVAWLSPGDLSHVQAIARFGSEVTAEDLILFADARKHHLEAWQYPEGYHTVKIIDSETGNVADSECATKEYAGLSSCNCGAYRQEALTQSFTTNRDIPLSDTHSLSTAMQLNNGLSVTVGPRSQASNTNHRMYISEGAKTMNIRASGMTPDASNSVVWMGIAQNGRHIEASLTMTARRKEPWDHIGTVNAAFNDQGQVANLYATTPEILDFLHVDIPRHYFDSGAINTYITNLDHAAVVMEGIAGVLGLEKWDKLDLRLTAAGLYATLGARDMDSIPGAIAFYD